MIFFLLLLMASLFICGLYKISKHHVVIMPDGRHRIDGEILKWFSAFIEQTNGISCYQYEGEQLEEKVRVLFAADRKLKTKLQVSPEKMSLMVKSGQTIDSEERRFIEDICQVRTFVNADVIFLFLDVPKYVFPKWVRFPVISCPVCMASVWGSLFWWGFVYFQKTAFSWSAHPNLLHWVMWPIFCIALSFVNYLFIRKSEL
jgi:hypothetical protein